MDAKALADLSFRHNEQFIAPKGSKPMKSASGTHFAFPF